MLAYRDSNATQNVLWQPHAGPQTTFLASDAYEALYGGAAGGGKSDALLFGALRQVHHSAYKALILRRTFPELTELMDRAHLVFRQVGGSWNESRKRYTFPSGATVQFGYCESYSDVLQYQGQQFTYIAFDELGQIAEERVWTYLMSRNRAAAPGLVMQMRASANPGGPGHAWIKRRFIRHCPATGETVSVGESSRAFVQALLSDNPTLVRNDPAYGKRLEQLPDLEYKWLAKGDWDAGAGMAFSDLDRDIHWKPAFPVPAHWEVFGSFDWGYAHPFAFGLFASDEDGTVYLVDSAHGRRLQPPEIAQRILDTVERNGLSRERLKWIAAGHDCWADVRARAENIPTIAEHFSRLGLPLVRANISRVSGVQNCRRYLASGQHVLLATEANRKVWDILESRVSDPDHPEDVLKTDADENGEGGDDAFDMWRYGLASRPLVAKALTVTPERDRSMPIDWSSGKLKKRPKAEDSLSAIYATEARRQSHQSFQSPWRGR